MYVLRNNLFSKTIGLVSPILSNEGRLDTLGPPHPVQSILSFNNTSLQEIAWKIISHVASHAEGLSIENPQLYMITIYSYRQSSFYILP